MSVLAVVSKSIFEKQARDGGRVLGVGDVWPTARYESHHAALEPLSAGGDLILVTVRPGDMLWVVAVLRAPKKDATGWAAAANVAAGNHPRITGLLPRHRSSPGRGDHRW